MYRSADAEARAAFAVTCAEIAKMSLRGQKDADAASVELPSIAPPSCCPDTGGFACQHIRQAATRRHPECVKHFWGMRTKGNLKQESFEKQAVIAALLNKDLAMLDYLLSRRCPWDPCQVNGIFFMSLKHSPWEEWRDLYAIAVKHKLLDRGQTQKLLLQFMAHGQWDFLEKICKHGQTFETLNTKLLALEPHGANVAALRELHVRKAFRTADLSWLTPQFALDVNDQALLKFACELQPALVAAAKEKAEDPAMREWLDNHLKKISYPKARLL